MRCRTRRRKRRQVAVPRPRKPGEWTPEHTQRVFVRPLRIAGLWGVLGLGALGVHLFVIELINAAV